MDGDLEVVDFRYSGIWLLRLKLGVRCGRLGLTKCGISSGFCRTVGVAGQGGEVIYRPGRW